MLLLSGQDPANGQILQWPSTTVSKQGFALQGHAPDPDLHTFSCIENRCHDLYERPLQEISKRLGFDLKQTLCSN